MEKDNFNVVHIIKERGVCPDISLFLFASKKNELQAIARLKIVKGIENNKRSKPFQHISIKLYRIRRIRRKK